MTLLIGILASDGAVIAADRQASHGAFGGVTVGQQVTKVRCPGNVSVFASSGPIGLHQQFLSILESESGEFKKRKYHSIAPNLQKKFRDVINPAMETAAKAAAVIGPQAAMGDAFCSSFLAAEFQDGLHVIDISPQAGFEAMTPDIPFVCHGSGKSNSDPLMGFLRSVYFPNRLPTLHEAGLLAYWTIKVAIELKTAGVGYDVDVFFLEKGQKSPRQLAPQELAINNQFIDGVADAMRAAAVHKAAGPEVAATLPVLQPNA